MGGAPARQRRRQKRQCTCWPALGGGGGAGAAQAQRGGWGGVEATSKNTNTNKNEQPRARARLDHAAGAVHKDVVAFQVAVHDGRLVAVQVDQALQDLLVRRGRFKREVLDFFGFFWEGLGGRERLGLRGWMEGAREESAGGPGARREGRWHESVATNGRTQRQRSLSPSPAGPTASASVPPLTCHAQRFSTMSSMCLCFLRYLFVFFWGVARLGQGGRR